MRYNKRFSWWQLAFASVVVSAIGGLSSGKPNSQERKLYEKELKQAPWAPPGWLFAPAWTINNFFLLKALEQLLHRKDIDKKKKLLIEQAIIWIIFFSFNYIYFNRKSTVLAALWTITDAALATSSFIISRKSNKSFSLLYLPLLGWTSFASTIAIYQALKNNDPVLHFNP
ncbi:tryptophan-rich sensory protein [Ilyomonas limi]|uniref:Tryptophan-rich sensory protein n=1 Tax=Ilyomonas limi TaxID=2575867 RepID=A0A4U3KYW6_9BACT|nr:TspO/MBR family protein [Ilyomonas limi]TKK66984.1 tryptophan-rich sensory protein [Ilyomonas limi]